MREKVIDFLSALGVTDAGDDALLVYVISNVTQTVKAETNLRNIPEELETVAIYMAAGQYLNLKKGSGSLAGFDLDAAVKQIQEGDTSVTFAVGVGSSTPEQRLDGLIRWLMNSGSGRFAAYRRLVW